MTAEEQQIVNEIAFEERAHVRFLRTALGANAVPMPNIDLSFFGPLATAAGITTSAGPAFNPFASFDDFLVGAFIFEDVGVTAYAGAAGLISSAGVAAGLLTAAAGILAVEAYHAGYVRTSLTGRAIAAGSAAAYPYLAAANKVEALRAMLTVGNSAAPSSAGSVETTLTLPMNITMPSAIVAADPDSAVGFSRTVNQVHHIVYGSATVGVGSGGFFPSGTNSIFATTTA
jgi:Ferritin-like domain